MTEFATVFKSSRSGGQKEPAWLASNREQALKYFSEKGFPTSKDEQWRYTSLTPLSKTDFSLPEKSSSVGAHTKEIKSFFLDEASLYRWVFINGIYSSELSSKTEMSQDVKIQSVAQVLAETPGKLEAYLKIKDSGSFDSLQALNTAFVSDGAFIRIGAKIELSEPIHLLFVSTSGEKATMCHPRNIIVAETGARASIVEHYVSLSDEDTSWTNAMTHIIAGDGASIEHCKVQQAGKKSYHLAATQVLQGKDSHVISHSFSLGSSIARNEINVSLDAEGSECILNGLYMGKESQVSDNTTQIFHRKPRTRSSESYKGILADHSRGIFNGKVFVKADAQQIVAEQSNKNLLLSDNATANTRPQLEIYADDVKCTHGATIGRLDEDALFYLRARGIGFEEAQSLLTLGFASEIVDKVSVTSLKHRLEGLLKGLL